MARRNALLPEPDPEVRARRIAGALFFTTCCSVFFVRLFFWEPGSVAEDPGQLTRAWVFTATLMGILLAHELGHYAVARHHGFRLSLPWFLPAPILVGTLGAVIRLEEAPRTRAGLLEMGAAGPFAGMAVVVVAMCGRLLLGEGSPTGTSLSTPLVWRGLSWLLHGEVVPLHTGDPIGFAAWLGCLLTALNLLPFGQLDGGHILAAVTPKWAERLGWGTTVVLLIGGLWWPGWAIWAAVLHLMGARIPVEARRDDGLPKGRPLVVAAAAVVLWFAVVMPVPL